jgi:hypothetical protein
MNITTRQSNIRKIDRNDPRFIIYDDIVAVPRAGFEISKSCPSEYQSILMQAVQAGWIKPVAHVHERELLFMGLSGN